MLQSPMFKMQEMHVFQMPTQLNGRLQHPRINLQSPQQTSRRVFLIMVIIYIFRIRL